MVNPMLQQLNQAPTQARNPMQMVPTQIKNAFNQITSQFSPESAKAEVERRVNSGTIPKDLYDQAIRIAKMITGGNSR